MAAFDAEVPVLKNLPAQDLNVTVFECVAPTTQEVISADNDPCFEGGLVVAVDEVLPVRISNARLLTEVYFWRSSISLHIERSEVSWPHHRSPPIAVSSPRASQELSLSREALFRASKRRGCLKPPNSLTE